MVYEWSAGTLEWLAEHGIEPYEVMQALLTGPRWPRPAVTAEGLAVPSIWGRTDAGRYLVVILRRDAKPYDWWIVLGRDMTTAEVAEFEQWEADRDTC